MGVTLQQIRVRLLAKLVVMHMVVLNVPRLGLHPVAPVDEPAHRAAAELGPVEAVVDSDLGAVTAMADVVPDHGPARTDGSADADRGDGVPGERCERGSGKTDGIQGQRPVEDLLQVLHILLVLPLPVLLLNRTHLVRPTLQIKVLPPLRELLGRDLCQVGCCSAPGEQALGAGRQQKRLLGDSRSSKRRSTRDGRRPHTRG
mmetsp:Transcript_39832/g.79835  ORF Transcript_39832/g.79835 Transcript_39832/m.79835 type:complete len:202 (-) Transcript_39832:214-819(-)